MVNIYALAVIAQENTKDFYRNQKDFYAEIHYHLPIMYDQQGTNMEW